MTFPISHYFRETLLIASGILSLSMPISSIGEGIFEKRASDDRLIYQRVAGDAPVRIDGTRATYISEKTAWTIVGAGQEPNENWHKQGTWNLTEPYEIYVLSDPLSGEPIYPFSKSLPNSYISNKIEFVGFPGEYEPASIVIRVGEKSLRSVFIKSGRLSCSHGVIIPASQFDIRLVKVWFQAGKELNNSRKQPKALIPELLVHDANIVLVDLQNQVNIIRNYNQVQDANSLVSFDIPDHSNQQIWITLSIPPDIAAGTCIGEAVLTAETNGQRAINSTLSLNLTVLPGTLEDSRLMHSLYYVGGKERIRPSQSIQDVNAKTSKQIERDLRDIREHGNTNVILLHDYNLLETKSHAGRDPRPLINLIKSAGFSDARLMYRDRLNFGIDDPEKYLQKLKHIKNAAVAAGFKNVIAFNADEAKLPYLLSHLNSFELAHQLNLLNATTIRPEFASSLSDVLDFGIIHRNRDNSALRRAGIIPWAYNNPQAGKEVPGEVRWLYGFGLWLDGFDGACGFAYQAARQSWDDWATPAFRAHLMSYPTISDPIPTLQWEAWREGIDDLRYLHALSRIKYPAVDFLAIKNRKHYLGDLLEQDIDGIGPNAIKSLIATKLLQLSQKH